MNAVQPRSSRAKNKAEQICAKVPPFLEILFPTDDNSGVAPVMATIRRIPPPVR